MTAATTDRTTLACEMAVLRALEVAGKKSLKRWARGQVPDVPAHLLHTRLRIAQTHEECDKLLVGAWGHLTMVLPDEGRLVVAVDWYVRELIVKRQPHTRQHLDQVLAVAGE
ncbi:hypothetical protein CH276_22715 [Rhodococcus sp. 06-470-2]|nr:hypothetical protein [Rhodococcus sp. 06-470-2]OZC59263.1 hypothetical protein CH276_22715 [Rhodococcus sp. 06-470-2]OZE63633.1 hypothetical protein CH265_12215 [Rhodococcus sp. 05-2221-1B]